jgi:tetratricopeptide (TPR) repeat protein
MRFAAATARNTSAIASTPAGDLMRPRTHMIVFPLAIDLTSKYTWTKVDPAIRADNDTRERSNLAHREILQLGVLILIALAAFLLTRAVAASNRGMRLGDAEQWYRRGQGQMSDGQVDEAVESFRHAAVTDRYDRRYVLALARALARRQDDEAARSVLLTLRESAPEDAEINLELARLAAHRDDATEAIRFYHNALYAPWPPERADARRRARLEVIRFLLTHHESGRALSELLAVSTDLPDEAATHLEVAQLFADAGDHGHSLEQFQRALRLAPDNATALTGAGHSAFQLGNYPLARSYLRRAPPEPDDAAKTRELVDLVVSSDPLASRIASLERRRRLAADFSYLQQRLNGCLDRATGQTTDDQAALQREADAFQDHLKPSAALEQDRIETGVELIDRIARHVARTCGPATTFDRALLLIGREHGADTR